MDGSMQVLRLLKTLKDYFKQMFRLLQVIFRVNFKDDFKTTILNSTQLGTTQPQLVTALFLKINKNTNKSTYLTLILPENSRR